VKGGGKKMQHEITKQAPLLDEQGNEGKQALPGNFCPSTTAGISRQTG